MKFPITLLIALASLSMPAQGATLRSATTFAAASAVGLKDAPKAVLTLFAYDATGKLLRSGCAFFTDERGNAAAPYSILVGAAKAEVVDHKGNKYAVARILGANSTYDLVRFSTTGTKKPAYLDIATTASSTGNTLYLLRPTNGKKQEPRSVAITADEAYNDFRYYTLNLANDASNFSSLLVNAEGQLVAVVQKNVSKDATAACAIDARFIPTLSITTMSVFSSDLHAIDIPKALPTEAKDAVAYIYMMSQTDSAAYTTTLSDFTTTYPDAPEGYVALACFHADRENYAEAERLFTTALAKAESPTRPDSLMHPDAVHYQMSRQIYSTAIRQADSTATPGWTLSRALAEAETAYGIEPHTLYLVQQGNCLFAQRRYAEAYATYHRATADAGYATSETFFSAARSLELSGGDTTQVMALMDSVIAHVPQPVSARDAAYYLQRSQRYVEQGRYREAVFDYNEYEKAVGPRNLTDQFYFLRYEAEVEAHMYQQALDDIRTAISYASSPLPYRIEEAMLLLRVGEFSQAIDAAKAVLNDTPDSSDCYKILGIAYGEQGNKALAHKYLQRCVELGDESAAALISKY